MPVTMLVYGISADARFVSYSILVFTFPVASMDLIIVPKIFVVRRMNKNARKNEDVASRPQESNQDGGVGSANPIHNWAQTNSNSTRNNESGPTVSSHSPRIQVVTFD